METKKPLLQLVKERPLTKEDLKNYGPWEFENLLPLHPLSWKKQSSYSMVFGISIMFIIALTCLFFLLYRKESLLYELGVGVYLLSLICLLALTVLAIFFVLSVLSDNKRENKEIQEWLDSPFFEENRDFMQETLSQREEIITLLKDEQNVFLLQQERKAKELFLQAGLDDWNGKQLSIEDIYES